MNNGIMGNIELIDNLADACEEAVAALHAGRHIQFCKLMYGIVVRLAQLKEGVRNDIESRNKAIQNLKNRLREAGVEVLEVSPEELIKNGEKGGET